MLKHFRFALLVLLPLLAMAGGGRVASWAPVPHGIVPTAEPPRGFDSTLTGSLDLPRPIARVPIGSQLGPYRHGGEGDGPAPQRLLGAGTHAIGHRLTAVHPLDGDVVSPALSHAHAFARAGALSSFSNGLPPPSLA